MNPQDLTAEQALIVLDSMIYGKADWLQRFGEQSKRPRPQPDIDQKRLEKAVLEKCRAGVQRNIEKTEAVHEAQG